MHNLGRTAAWWIPFLAVAIVGPGCRQDRITVADQARYGSHYGDYRYCLGLIEDYESKKDKREISQSDVDRLESLQLQAGPISVDATDALGAYATVSPELKQRLIRHVPRLLNSDDPSILRSAASVARWYRLEQYDGALAATAKRLHLKKTLNEEETFLLEDLSVQEKK
jgi:hypothetical protein